MEAGGAGIHWEGTRETEDHAESLPGVTAGGYLGLHIWQNTWNCPLSMGAFSCR